MSLNEYNSKRKFKNMTHQNSIMIFALKQEMEYFCHGRYQRDLPLTRGKRGLQLRQKIIHLTISTLKESFQKATMELEQLLYGTQAPIQLNEIFDSSSVMARYLLH